MDSGTLDTKDYHGWLLPFLYLSWGIFMDFMIRTGRWPDSKPWRLADLEGRVELMCGDR